jgi:hypothetical protein
MQFLATRHHSPRIGTGASASPGTQANGSAMNLVETPTQIILKAISLFDTAEKATVVVILMIALSVACWGWLYVLHRRFVDGRRPPLHRGGQAGRDGPDGRHRRQRAEQGKSRRGR